MAFLNPHAIFSLSIFLNKHFFISSLLLFSYSAVSDSLRSHGLQHARPPCPSPTPRAYSNSCPLSQWCNPTISSSVDPFSSHLQSLPASGSFPVSQFFTSGGLSIGVSASASVLPMNTQEWSPLGWTGWISLQSKDLAFFGAQPCWRSKLWVWRTRNLDRKPIMVHKATLFYFYQNIFQI